MIQAALQDPWPDSIGYEKEELIVFPTTSLSDLELLASPRTQAKATSQTDLFSVLRPGLREANRSSRSIEQVRIPASRPLRVGKTTECEKELHVSRPSFDVGHQHALIALQLGHTGCRSGFSILLERVSGGWRRVAFGNDWFV